MIGNLPVQCSASGWDPLPGAGNRPKTWPSIHTIPPRMHASRTLPPFHRAYMLPGLCHHSTAHTCFQDCATIPPRIYASRTLPPNLTAMQLPCTAGGADRGGVAGFPCTQTVGLLLIYLFSKLLAVAGVCSLGLSCYVYIYKKLGHNMTCKNC